MTFLNLFMNLTIKNTCFTLTLLLSFSIMAQDIDFSQMSESEQQVTGIHKLSASEQEALLRWITQKQQALIMAERKKNLGLKDTLRNMDESTVKARLDNHYSNAIGDQFYQLSNGQIWKQTSSGRITIDKDGPQIITIEPGFMGSWTLTGDGNRSVKVKRIK